MNRAAAWPRAWCAAAALALALCLLPSVAALRAVPAPLEDPERGRQSVRAFASMATVLTHPRCLNCHIPGDAPLNGDQSKPHRELNIKRGPDGRGTPAMRCSNCHQKENSPAPHAPPGAPDWHLPPPSQPMAWQGLTTGELCRTLKDPTKNGGMTLADLYRHLDEHPLVLWAWNPGPGRTLPPLSHQEFMTRVKEWIDTGASCPGGPGVPR
jgi:hypothetical protein